MKTFEEKLQIIRDSHSINDDAVREVLPDPNGDNGYYFVYYPETLYKEALIDIVLYSAGNLRIWYDRRLEHGSWWEEEMLDKIGEYNCIGVIVYLNKETLLSPFFYKLCRKISQLHKNYCSVNYEKDGIRTLSGSAVLNTLPHGKISAESKELYEKMFSNSVTFIHGDAPINEKIRAIRMLKREDLYAYTYSEGEATVVAVKDIFAEELTIPSHTERDGKLYTVTKIAALTFANCKFLKNIYFPETIREIGFTAKPEALKNCKVLNSQDFQKIETAADAINLGRTFSGCSSLSEIVLPQSMERVAAETFFECKNLRSIDFGGAKYIHSEAICSEFGKLESKESRIEHRHYRI